MKNILFIITVLLGNQVALGMDTASLALNTAARALGISTHELSQLQQISESEICKVGYFESCSVKDIDLNFKGYSATLHNSNDTISAIFFPHGHIKCTRYKKNKDDRFISIPLDNNVYYQLHTLYKAQKQ